ncbi:hypothetical protein ACN4EE_17985 [Geminocystis sp. CENA526]|uniref:hypothetical protein n=1 Tax=Geminocystis sp. CENA526 TaxID=1355871 RepID=UPI003D6FABFE
MKKISQFRLWVLDLFLNHVVVCLIALFVIGIGIALSNMSSLSRTLIQSQSLQNSEYQANAIIQAWQLYSNAAASRLANIEGVNIRHDYFLGPVKQKLLIAKLRSPHLYR